MSLKKYCRPHFGCIFASVILQHGRTLESHVPPQDWPLGNHSSGFKVQWENDS